MLALLTSILVISVLAILLLFSFPNYASDEPRLIPGIPILGYTLSFARDRRSLARWAYAKNKKQPFALLIGSRRHYFFHKPNEYAAIFRNSKTLSISEFIKLLYVNWFGMKAREADRLLGDLAPAIHDINNTILLRPENNSTTASLYFIDLDTRVRALTREILGLESKCVTIDAPKLVADLQGNASTTAYFGESILARNPDLMKDLQIFNKEGFWPLLVGAPRLLYPRPYAAKDRLLSSMTRLIDAINTGEGVASSLVEAHARTLLEKGVSKDSVASDLFGLLFGLNSNSIPNAFCALLQMTSRPEIIEAFRIELTEAGYTTLAAAQYANIIPESVPRLRAFLQEVFRKHINSTVLREVVSPTVLTIDGRSWTLRKGGIVTLCGSMLHHDEDLHPEADRFIAERFLGKRQDGWGENYSKTTKAFGGGSSYCPGRVFAEKQIIGFLAAICMNFDLKIITEGFTIPECSDFEHVLNCPSIALEIRQRDFE